MAAVAPTTHLMIFFDRLDQITQTISTPSRSMFAVGGVVNVLAMWYFEPTSLLTQVATFVGATTAVFVTSALCGRCCRRTGDAQLDVPLLAEINASLSAATDDVERPWYETIGTPELRKEKGFSEFIEACKTHSRVALIFDELILEGVQRNAIVKATYQAITGTELGDNTADSPFHYARLYTAAGGDFARVEIEGVAGEALIIKFSALPKLFANIQELTAQLPAEK